VEDFLGQDGTSRGLVLTGEPGIGKSTLWVAAIDVARRRGMRVVSTRASGAEARLAFAGLIDMLDEVDLRRLECLPGPQLTALEVALLRAEPGDAPPDRGAIAFGFRNALRALASEGPLLVAVDDLQWLDAPSGDALAFAARRLDDSPVSFLLARRPGRSAPLERALAPLKRLEVGPLSLGATRYMLAERLELSLPRQLLRRIVDATLGNPLFALELGRGLAAGELPAIGEELPVPDAVEHLLGERVVRLSGDSRRLLLAVALGGDLREGQAVALADLDALDEAVQAGMLVADGDRVRPAHPLLAAAAAKHSGARERRELHLALADVVEDDELRARHLALAARAPDEALAKLVAGAAAGAAARGAVHDAAVLGKHALRLTPPDAAERSERVLALAHFFGVAAEKQQLTDLLTTELENLPTGSARARACLLLPGGAVRRNDEIRAFLERALAESEGLPEERGVVLANMATNEAVIRVERIRDAEAWAEEALAAVPATGGEMHRIALYSLAWPRSLRGRPIDDLRARFAALSNSALYLLGTPDRIAGQQLVWRGRLDEARALLSTMLSTADDRGEPMSYALARLHICELELRAGDWEAAERLLDEWSEPWERKLLAWPMYERCRALLAAGRGLPEEAERWAAEAIARAEEAGVGWDRLEALRARGTAALLDHDPLRAVEALGEVWAHAERVGIEEPGVFPVAPDLVEAWVEMGELDEAQSVTSRLRGLSARPDHPWGLATAKRCAGVVGLATEYRAEAAHGLDQAVLAYERLGLRFDAARTLLALGRAQRRHRKWGAARRSLELAEVAFADLGSPGWVDEARSELDRVSARRPQASGELTPAERRVAELAGDGLANKEIARVLFVSVKTVEGHLSHIYAKLGVRSRAQLARHLSGAA
jgi:DNA-binding CsgD family transcriptional regulator/tetratricopeptide (TPR) repeat protein